MVNTLVRYQVFSTFDLNSGYHQVTVEESGTKYTGFDANGRLYHFRRVPFGVTNGVAIFQCAMDKMVEDEGFTDTFPYLNNITVASNDQKEHDANIQRFLEAVRHRNLTINKSKSVESVTSISILGYCVLNGTVKPNPEGVRDLQEFPPPSNSRSLCRVVGMFAHYAK